MMAVIIIRVLDIEKTYKLCNLWVSDTSYHNKGTPLECQFCNKSSAFGSRYVSLP